MLDSMTQAIYNALYVDRTIFSWVLSRSTPCIRDVVGFDIRLKK